MNALIGTGFWAKDPEDFRVKKQFRDEIWLPNLHGRDTCAVDNNESGFALDESASNRVIKVRGNLGHVGSHLGQYRPHLLGYSMSWIIPAMIAYSEHRDFIYLEQDALAFGDWERVMYDDCDKKQLAMAFGEGSRWACCEQSLFLIKWDFITEAIWSYISIPEGDGLVLPESKFEIMEHKNMRVGRFSLQGGRERPLPMESKTFYGQKFSAEELDQLRIFELIK